MTDEERRLIDKLVQKGKNWPFDGRNYEVRDINQIISLAERQDKELAVADAAIDKLEQIVSQLDQKRNEINAEIERLTNET